MASLLVGVGIEVPYHDCMGLINGLHLEVFAKILCTRVWCTCLEL